MIIKEVYEKYKHLDELLSDPKLLRDRFELSILYFLWRAIKLDLYQIIKDERNNRNAEKESLIRSENERGE